MKCPTLLLAALTTAMTVAAAEPSAAGARGTPTASTVPRTPDTTGRAPGTAPARSPTRPPATGAGRALHAPGDADPVEVPATDTAERPRPADTSLWAQWTRGAIAGRDDVRHWGSAVVQRFRRATPPPADGSLAVPSGPGLRTATATPAADVAMAPTPRPCPGCDGPSATPPRAGMPVATTSVEALRPEVRRPIGGSEPSATLGADGEVGGGRPASWRFGVERTSDDPNPAATRPTRLRVTVAREWPL